MTTQTEVLNARPPIASGAGSFFFRMSVACFAVAVIGFAPSYWIPLLRGNLDVAPIVHLHAACFYGWTLMFMRQTWLVSVGQTGRHRELGMAGVALAAGMFFAGMGAAIHSIKRMDAAGFGLEGRPFSIIAVSSVTTYAVLVAVAIFKVRNPELHKRLMLVATVSILPAAIARWFILIFASKNLGPQGGVLAPPPMFVTIPPSLLSDLLIVVAIVHDKRTRGSVHPAYWIAGGCVLAVQILRVPLSMTSAWLWVVNCLVSFAP